MKWKKQGLIYAPSGDLWWAKSYASFPTVEQISGKYLRVYFASLDQHKNGRIGFVDLDAAHPQKILQEAKEPILDLGDIGEFDDSGVNPFSIITVETEKFLFYQGWQRCERVPYLLFTGLAIGKHGDPNFVKYSRIPILDRTDDEPYMRAAPFVLFEDNRFKMWYASCSKWIVDENGLHYRVTIRYATSKDGAHWESDRHVCVSPNSPDEYAVGRPSVIHEGDKYRMWYSIRAFSKPYRIGYAESPDGLEWTRKDDEVGITVSDTGWDSEMICYPCVVDVNGQRFMFYNGNRHGSTGFGYAVLED